MYTTTINSFINFTCLDVSKFHYFFLIILPLFQHLESVIRARIPSITSLINKTIDELEAEMNHIGRPIALDAGVRFYFLITYAVNRNIIV